MKCRHCNTQLKLTFVDLGSAPPSNAYLISENLDFPEKWYPLHVLVCENCWLVQTEDFTHAEELFKFDYAYFSGFSNTWLKHSEKYAIDMIERFQIDKNALVIEVASNDGSLLQFFNDRKVKCLGIEPTKSTAEEARRKGLDIVEDFFGVKLAMQLVNMGKKADLAVANNVLAHVPDINDFVRGFSIILKPNGIVTFEFPHLYRLVNENQFDTIYHEHFSYLSLTSVKEIFKSNGLKIFDVEEHPTHGGSLRVFAQRSDSGNHFVTDHVNEILYKEECIGMRKEFYYCNFQVRAEKIKNDFLLFLLNSKLEGKKIVGYGAAAKGNTLINFAGIRPDLIKFIVDRNPYKQSKFMPGSHIPIVGEEYLKDEKPEYIVIFPWNLKNEISCQLNYVKEWGAKFVTAIPKLDII